MPRLWNRVWSATIAVALLGSVYEYAFATASINVQLEKNVLRVGEQTQLEIVVSTQGEQISGQPSVPSVEGVNFVFYGQTGNTQSFTVINGQASSSIQATYVYDVFAVKEGKYTVNEISVTTNAGTVKANPIEITVFPSQQPLPQSRSPLISAPQGSANLNVFLLADTTKKEVYKGEELILSYDGVYHQRWKRWFDQAIISKGEYASFKEEKGALKDFLVEAVDMRFQQDIKPVRLPDSRDMFFQKPLRRFILFPLNPGNYTLTPMSVEFAIPVQQQVSMFPFKPQPIQLVVKPLPEEGKPDIFEGAVGSFNLQASAEPLELKEGETVTLKIILEGIGNIKNAPKPILPDLSKFDQFDPTQNESISVTDSGMRGRIEYSHVMIPHDVNANEIGAVRYAYFDPTEKKYVVKQTPPISLTIHPAAPGSQRTGSTLAFNRRLITRVGDDFRFIFTSPEGTSYVFLALHRSLRIRLLFLLPILLALLASVWKWRSEFLAMRPTVAKSIKAPKLARRLLADARKSLERNEAETVYIKLSKAITDYIDNRWNLACAGMTGLELKDALTGCGVGDGYTTRVIAILEEFDGARFSGAAQNPARLREDLAKAEELLGELMKVKSV